MNAYPEPSWHGADPDEPDFKDALHERYRRLREVAPVNLTPRGTWRLTRHADVVRLLRRTAVGMRTTAGTLPTSDESQLPRLFMLDQDPPNHTRLRRLVARYFTPRAMHALHARVVTITEGLLDAAGSGDLDLVAALALPLPTAVICEMMGVPPGDRDVFTQWSSDLTYFLLGDLASAVQRERSQAAIGSLIGYINELADERRETPGDDLLSVLLQAEEDGDKLSPMEFLWQVIGLIIAGFETTTGLIGNGVRQLLLHPDQLARLRAAPTLLETAVEECLRFDPPIVATGRVLHEPAEFGGYTLPKNARVVAALAAANRDPEVFPEPDTFDVARAPNNHLGFGGGLHTCLGAHLARLEARVAYSKLLDRYAELELVDEKPAWSMSLFRIPSALRVRARERA